MKLHIESLEDRRALAAYTTRVLDPNNLVPADVERKMLANLDFAMRNASNFVSWKGVLDAQVRVRPMMSGYEGGVFSSIDSDMPGNRSGTVYEMLTGIDPNGSAPDLGADVWVAMDGTVKTYGMNAWYDPSPATYVPANVPAGHFDFVGVLTHELFHGFGFRQTVDFTKYVTTVNGNRYFNGPNTVALLGRPLPMSPWGGTHYGNTSLPENPIGSGLMFQWGNYAGNRLDIGKLDLAILKDIGHTVKNTDGLPLVDRIDSQMPRIRSVEMVVPENMAPGTAFAVLLTTAGRAGFSFSLPEGMRDNGSFRIVGDRVLTDSLLDYETKRSYVIEVKNVDPAGVWTHTVVNVRVKDMDDTPKIVAPSRVSMNNGALSLGSITLAGDSSQAVSMAIFSRRGVITSRISDPAVKVYVVRNTIGGTTAFLVGSIHAINRNTRHLNYSGDDSKLVIDIGACIGGVCRNYGRHDLELIRSQVVRPLPSSVTGRFSSLRV